jgi:hypothetical protein
MDQVGKTIQISHKPKLLFITVGLSQVYNTVEGLFRSQRLHELDRFLPRSERWSRFAGQFGGKAKVDFGFDYAASFSSFCCVA